MVCLQKKKSTANKHNHLEMTGRHTGPDPAGVTQAARSLAARTPASQGASYLLYPGDGIGGRSPPVGPLLQGIQQVGRSPRTLLRLRLVLDADPGHSIGHGVLI